MVALLLLKAAGAAPTPRGSALFAWSRAQRLGAVPRGVAGCRGSASGRAPGRNALPPKVVVSY
jgi:hypothetical protein